MAQLIRALLFLLVASPAWADTPMTGAEFQAYTEGKTLSYGSATNPEFGVESYLPNRRVLWSVTPGECKEGKWYQDGTNICFSYRNDPVPKCWEVFRTDNGIRSVFTNVPGGTVLFEARESRPLICDDMFS